MITASPPSIHCVYKTLNVIFVVRLKSILLEKDKDDNEFSSCSEYQHNLFINEGQGSLDNSKWCQEPPSLKENILRTHIHIGSHLE